MTRERDIFAGGQISPDTPKIKYAGTRRSRAQYIQHVRQPSGNNIAGRKRQEGLLRKKRSTRYSGLERAAGRIEKRPLVSPQTK